MTLVDVKRKAVIYGIVMTACVWAWMFTHSEKAKIRRVFDDVTELAHRDPGETVLECAAKIKGLAKLIKSGCTFFMPEFGSGTYTSSRNLTGAAIAYRNGLQAIRVEFRELEVTVTTKWATVKGVVDFTGTDMKCGIETPYERQFEATFEKADGDWLFTRVIVRE